jgi:hypothetical protein
MVGNPNLPADVDSREDLQGESMPTPGLDALDQEREASMADEGGMSGALVESQDREECEGSPTMHRPFPRAADLPTLEPQRAGRARWLALGALGMMVLAGGVLLLRARR